MTLTEALQFGVVPIVRDSYSSLHDIVVDDENGYILDANSLNLFAEKLTYLMNNKFKRDSLALAGLHSSSSFNQESVAQKWEVLIRNLCTA